VRPSVLLRRAESDLHTSSPKAGNSRWPKRVAVADDEVDREAECLGSHGTCIGGHDKDDAVLPIGPRAVERRSIDEAAEGLRCVSVYNVNLGVAQEKVSDKHWIYFPEQEFPFYRVGFPTNFSPSLGPPGCSSLYVEVSHQPTRAVPEATIIGVACSGTVAIPRFPRERPHVRVEFFEFDRGAIEPSESPQEYSTRLLGQLRERAPIEVAGRKRAAALAGRVPTWSSELAITGKPGGKGALEEALSQGAATRD